MLTLGNVDTSYTIRIRLLKWDAPEDADTRCFDKFIEDLRRHENAHADVCRENMPKKLDAAKAAIDGLEVRLEGPCEVQDGQVNLSEAQGGSNWTRLWPLRSALPSPTRTPPKLPTMLRTRSIKTIR